MKKSKITNKRCTIMLLTGFLVFALTFVLGRLGQTVYAAEATSGKIEGIGWNYNETSKSLDFNWNSEVETGEIPDFNNLSDRPWNAYKDDIAKVNIWGGSTKIKAIGKNAFRDLSNLYSVEIYDYITEIRSGAFSNCSRLKEISVPDTAKGHIAKDAFDVGVKIKYYCTHPKDQEKFRTYNIEPATLTADGWCDVEWYCGKCGEHLQTDTNRVIPRIYKLYLKQSNYSYTGKVITPVVVAKDWAGYAFIKGKDYTVGYASGRKNVGSYTVTVKEKNIILHGVQ